MLASGLALALAPALVLAFVLGLGTSRLEPQLFKGVLNGMHTIMSCQPSMELPA